MTELARRCFSLSECESYREHLRDGCFTLALALLLDLPVETVPNFFHDGDPRPMPEKAAKWVAATQGLSLVWMIIPWPQVIRLEAVVHDLNAVNPGVPFILSGVSKYDDEEAVEYHSVLCCDGAIIDPFRTGIRGGYIYGGDRDVIVAYLGGPISASALAMVKR